MWTKILVALVNWLLSALSKRLSESKEFQMVTFRDRVEIRERTAAMISATHKEDNTHED